MLVVFTNYYCCLGFLCCHFFFVVLFVFANTSQVIGWEDRLRNDLLLFRWTLNLLQP